MPDDLFGLEEDFKQLLNKPKEPDEFMLAAMREVDALTPSVPRIAPVIKPPELDRHVPGDGGYHVKLWMKFYGGYYSAINEQVVMPDGQRISRMEIEVGHPVWVDKRIQKR